METVISDEKISVSEFRTMLFEDGDTYYYEIIDGHMIRKSAPTPLHQRISRKLLLVLDKFISESKSGELFQSPIDVYLDEYN
ncbi:MAG: Uma2 family endonuclease, partial [Chitinophagaceae bacterium]|nr:Uma2 family endonuclease [Chitinophagaceae bacterium]